MRTWQEATKERAARAQLPAVFTLMGRSRPLPDLQSSDGRKRGHAQRAAINTPIQGSAADVAAAAMIAICQCERLKELGWKLLMQVGRWHGRSGGGEGDGVVAEAVGFFACYASSVLPARHNHPYHTPFLP